MLLQFNFKNFESFREEASFDMTATGISDYADSVIREGTEKILPLAGIYGANASGKSNVIDALVKMNLYVRCSLIVPKDKAERLPGFQVMPFLFDRKSSEEPTSFEVFFILPEEGDKTFQYGFTVKNGCILEEWLNSCAKTARGKYRKIFYRDAEENVLELDGIPKKMRENIRISLRKEVLIISLGAQLCVPVCELVWDWFGKLDFTDFGDPMKNYFLSTSVPKDFTEKRVQERVVHFLSAFDPSIIGFHVEELPLAEDGKKRLSIQAEHRLSGGTGKTSIPLQAESAGTLKMFALYQHLENVFRDGGILCVDELNGKLHPLLVRSLLAGFNDPERNPKHAQLIFTSHDPWSLEHAELRRDEIWFTEKDEEGRSSLYSLADFSEDARKARKDENHEKNYMLGKYGAVPDLEIFRFGEETEPYGKE